MKKININISCLKSVPNQKIRLSTADSLQVKLRSRGSFNKHPAGRWAQEVLSNRWWVGPWWHVQSISRSTDSTWLSYYMELLLFSPSSKYSKMQFWLTDGISAGKCIICNVSRQGHPVRKEKKNTWLGIGGVEKSPRISSNQMRDSFCWNSSPEVGFPQTYFDQEMFWKEAAESQCTNPSVITALFIHPFQPKISTSLDTVSWKSRWMFSTENCMWKWKENEQKWTDKVCVGRCVHSQKFNFLDGC